MYDARQEPNEFVADSLANAKAKAAELAKKWFTWARMTGVKF